MLTIDLIKILTDAGAVGDGSQNSVNNFIKQIADMIAKEIVDNFPYSRITVQNKDQAIDYINDVQNILPDVTNSDGTVNTTTFKSLLVLQGQNPDTVDRLIPQNTAVKASDVNNSLNSYKRQIQDSGTIVVLDQTEISATLVPIITNSMKFSTNYTVTEPVASPRGKWQQNIGNVIMAEAKYLLKAYLLNTLRNLRANPPQLRDKTIQSLLIAYINGNDIEVRINEATNNTNMQAYALTANFVIKDKLSAYKSPSKIRANLIDYTNGIYERIGTSDPSTITAPLGDALNQVQLIKSFLDNTFIIIVFLLTILSIILVYSLMNSNVEEKTYEFGMLRALGFFKQNLINLMVTQALFFGLPGMALGMIISYVANTLVSFILLDYAKVSQSYLVSGDAVALGVTIGIIMPIVSNILPIQRALSKNLRDSLNLYTRVINEVEVQILKLQSLGLSATQFLVATMLVVLGIISYYLAPYAIVYNNNQLFLLIMNAILILLVMGYAFFSNIGQPVLERLILKIIVRIFYRPDRILESVIIKNFESHKKRNTKTAIMFTIALSFLIFSGTTIKLQGGVVVNNIRAQFGADFVIMSLSPETKYMNESGIRGFMADYMRKYPNDVENFTFITLPLEKLPYFSKPLLSAAAGYPGRVTSIIGIEESYMKATYQKFLTVTGVDRSFKFPKLTSGKPDLAYSLYTNDSISNYQTFDDYNVTSNNRSQNQMVELAQRSGLAPLKLIVSEGLHYIMSLNSKTPALLISDDISYHAKVRASAAKVPGFVFSRYRAIAYSPTTLISTADMRIMINNRYKQNSYAYYLLQQMTPAGSSYDIPKGGFLLNFKKDLAFSERTRLKNALSVYTPGFYTIVVDTIDTTQNISDTLSFLNLFFILVAAISLILSFFLILVSFVSNIKENAWEFGVLRAIGLNKNQMSRIYIYEAFCLTTAASFLGSIVGITTAISIISQFNLYTEMPFEFSFPTEVFVFSVLLALSTSVLGSLYALNTMRSRQISYIIKGLEE